MKFLEFIVILVLVGVLAAGGYVGLGELRAKDVQISALQLAARDQASKDVAAAGAAETGCAARVAGAVRAGAAIAQLAAPASRTDPKVQPMYSAADIRSVMQ